MVPALAPHHSTQHGCTPLLLAATACDVLVTNMLVKAKSDVRAVDEVRASGDRGAVDAAGAEGWLLQTRGGA